MVSMDLLRGGSGERKVVEGSRCTVGVFFWNIH